MQYKIPRLILYAGVIALATICIFAIIDNYDLAVQRGLSTTLSCYMDQAFDQKTGLTKQIRICDTYNPQLVFYGSILLLVFDAIIFHYFNKSLGGYNEISTRNFAREINRHLNQNQNHSNSNSNRNNNKNGVIL